MQNIFHFKYGGVAVTRLCKDKTELNKPVTARDKFVRVQALLGVTAVQLGKLLGVSPQTIANWKKDEPKLSPVHRQRFIAIGLNPSYLDGIGQMLLPHVELEDVVLAIRNKVRNK